MQAMQAISHAGMGKQAKYSDDDAARYLCISSLSSNATNHACMIPAALLACLYFLSVYA
jgi:hypothetical protein